MEDRHSALPVVKHSVGTPPTTAILATAKPINEVDLVPFLNAAHKASTNPMTIPTALADTMIGFEASVTANLDDMLSQLEKNRDALLGSAAVVSSSTGIVDQTAKHLDNVRFALGRLDRRLQGLKLLFNATTQYMQELHDAISSQQSQQEADTAKRILEALNNNLRSDVDQLLLQLQNNNVRVQTQQQLVHNVMTTREAMSGRLIATVGMRDGAAMKALALLTMVFLPGTFISTLFSMPVINWSNSKLPIGGFALYWVRSVLSTVVVLSAWALWMRFNERRHSKRLQIGNKAV